MRDIAFSVFFVYFLITAFRVPFIGVALWVWTSLIVPTSLIYGFATSLRANLTIALATMLSFIFNKSPKVSLRSALFFLVVFYAFWTLVTSLTTISVPSIVWEEWIKFMKIFLLFLFVTLIVEKRLHIDTLCWAIVLSVGFHSTVEALKFINSGGGHNVRGPIASLLTDRNHFSVAVAMMLPIAAYLVAQAKKMQFKVVLIGVIFLGVLAIIGTSSRGGFVGLAILGIVWGLRTKRKFLNITLMIIIAGSALSLAPSDWRARMSTIESAGEDSSFMGRVVSWKQSTLIALDNPFTGGGFYAVQDWEVWQHYAIEFHKLDFITSPEAADTSYAVAAHSVYFQVLGDHGFVGLILFLLMLYFSYRTLMSLYKDKSNEDWLRTLSQMLSYSLLVYGIIGSTVGMANFDLLYAIFGLVIVLQRVAKSAGKELPRERYFFSNWSSP